MNKSKMPIVLIGNNFKYEIEAVVKIFFPSGTRFEFIFEESTANFDKSAYNDYIIAYVIKKYSISLCAELKIDGCSEKMYYQLPHGSDKDTVEHELCRLIYTLLSLATDIYLPEGFSSFYSPWGLMTGIRPVKKVIELIRQGKTRDEAEKILEDKYILSPKKFRLAYETAVNQMPILEKINKNAVSLYISIPFCPTRCSYCSFVSHSMDSAVKLIPEYIEKLCLEIEYLGNLVRETNTSIDTIYFGGGTPTSLSAEQIKIIMECVQKNFDLDNIREYSFEAGRPDTITEEKLRVIKAYGADRISVNPQTLNDSVLKAIGRNHSSGEFFKAFETARKIGFNNINTDLIAGLPTDTPDSFRNTLDKIIELNPESITVHTLTLKRSSDLFANGVQNNLADEMIDYSVETLVKNDYFPYYLYRQKNTLDNLENVGYAKKGFESCYNIFIMDETQIIIGAGCSASTKMVYPDGKISRIHNYKFPYEYIRNFDRLMDKKKELVECLKKISSLQQR
ncbi:MAG: coproporphyrinogen dehydrogenase HemZ [Ruminococcus sp.]|nr:coproporphyrinogen dehydrogenase HemZ [Ruminococcus sp.]